MSLVEIDFQPSVKKLRNFGKIAVAASGTVAVVLYVFKGLALQWCLLLFGLGLLTFVSTFVWLKLTRILYLGLTVITMPIGFVVSFFVMASFYFLILTPVGLVFRLIGRDRLYRKFDPDCKSYWVRHQSAKSAERYFRQF